MCIFAANHRALKDALLMIFFASFKMKGDASSRCTAFFISFLSLSKMYVI